MKILLVAIGTRGDIEPFLAVGKMLKDRGHDVYCAVSEQFEKYVLETGLEFRSLGPGFLDIGKDQDGRRILGNDGTVFQKTVSIVRQFIKHKRNKQNLLDRQYSFVQEVEPDHVIHSGLAFYPFIWGLKNRFKSTLILPIPYIIHPCSEHSHVIFNIDWGPVINRFTYTINNWAVAREIKNSAKILNRPMHLRKHQIMRRLLTYKTVFTVSTSLVTPPDSQWVKAVGLLERNLSTDWKPSEQLLQFINLYDKILFITFGSMVSNHPAHNTETIVNILEQQSIPAIINTADGALKEPANYNTNLIHFVSRIPYDWILPKMYAIVHHGGSGTVHFGLQYGCATLIIPHIFDHFMWNNIIVKKELGPRGIKISRISVKNLTPKILDLYNNPVYKSNAMEISGPMQEDFDQDELFRFILDRVEN